MIIERISLGKVSLEEKCWGIKLNSGNNISSLVSFLGEAKNHNISVGEIIFTNPEPGLPSNSLITFSSEEDVDFLIQNVRGEYEKVLLTEVMIEGSGLSRSYETLPKVFLKFKEQGINILAQMCTDLSLHFYIEPTQASIIYKAMYELVREESTKDFNLLNEIVS